MPKIEQSVQYLLDTNILLAYVRWKALAQYIEATYKLASIEPIPIISIVTEAEIRVLAAQLNWDAFKMRMLQEKLLDYLILVPIVHNDIIKAYLEIDDFSRRHGVSMGKNDLWIAATAQVEGATILTTDQDFDHLPQSLVKHLYIDPNSHL